MSGNARIQTFFVCTVVLSVFICFFAWLYHSLIESSDHGLYQLLLLTAWEENEFMTQRLYLRLWSCDSKEVLVIGKGFEDIIGTELPTDVIKVMM